MTFNVWERNDEIDLVLVFLRLSNADVLILQEVNLGHLEALANQLPGFPYRTSSPGVRNGVAIFSRWPLRSERVDAPHAGSRIVRVALDWNGVPMTVFGAHLSWPLG